MGVFVSFLLAWGTYRLIENRVRFSALLAPSPLRSIVLGICLTCVGTGSALTLRSMAKASMTSLDQVMYTHVRDDLPRIYKEGCHQPFSKEDSPECAYGDIAARRTMVLFGDSHAAQWFPALERIAEEKKWRLVSLTKSACPSVWVTPNNPELGRQYEECARWQVAAMRRIAEERPTLVILANSSKYVQDRAPGIYSEQWRAGMHRTLIELRRSGASVVVLRDTPWPGFDIPTCLSRAAWRSEDVMAACSFDRGSSLNAHVFELERGAAEEIDRVSVLDLSDLVCLGSLCQPFIKGMVAYRDTHHLTVGVSASLAPTLLERVGAQLVE